LWEQPLKAEFKTFFKALGNGVAHTLAGKKEDVLADAVEAATAIGITTPPEQLAGRLVERALERAMSALVDEAVDVFSAQDITEEKAEQIADRIDAAMEVGAVELNRDFFERPGDSPVVKGVQKTFTNWLMAMGVSKKKAEGLSARLPCYFTFALQEEWRTHAAVYQPLRASLDTPFARASEREEQWNLYTAWLSRQADQRMFDETFSVREVYIRSRAAFARKKTKDRCGVTEGADPEAPKPKVVWLKEYLDAWLETWDSGDAIRVLSGGPGSGKSAFARLFAAEVARRGKCRVIYVPLHLFELKADLVAAVHGFCDSHPHLPKGVLDAKDGESRLLLIFDGLDELEKQGRMAAQVAYEFVAEVGRAVERLNQAKVRLMVLLCGRPVAVQAGETVLRREEQILHLLPYVLTGDEAQGYEDPRKILSADQRDEWWAKYGARVGKDYAGLPRELQRDDFREITAQPLLNYLVALSFDRGKLDFGQDVNLNVVYRDLLEAVYERAYERRRSRSVEGLNQRDFVRVLEEVGLAAWHGDGRTTTVKKIQARCNKTPAVLKALSQFAGDAETGVTRLLTAFYFRQHGDIDGEKTFEFTHKSFGEYLTACRIIRELKLIHGKLRERDEGDEGGFDEQQSLERWVDLCGPSEITHELHRFLKKEVATHPVADAGAWQKSCVRLINHLLRHGMPMEKLSPLPTFKELDRQARNAEESLLALLNACAERSKALSNIEWPEDISFGAWLSRLSPQRNGPSNRITLISLSFINLEDQIFYCSDLYESIMNNIQANNCAASFVVLYGASLERASLEGAYLQGANLEGAYLQGAYLQGAYLQGANLQGANLQGANLQGANLQGANLKRANLEGANLERAYLHGANLEGAKGLN
jgi:hypothetical protein